MRRVTAVAALICVIAPRAFAQDSPRSVGYLGPAIANAVAAGATTLVVMPLGEGDDRVWATWTDEATSMRSVWLALIRRQHGAATPVWAVQSEQGYAPRLSKPSGWNFETRPVLLLRYQLGAAFTHADIYGVDRQGKPTSLGAIEGALIEEVEVGGSERLKIYDTADLKGPPTCYGWNHEVPALKKSDCDGR